MNNINNYVAEGHLFSDARSHGDNAYVSVGVNRSYKDPKSATGYSTVTSSIPLRIGKHLAKAISHKLVKGARVTFNGSLSTYAGKEVKEVESGKQYRQAGFIVDVEKINIFLNDEQKKAFNANSASNDQPPAESYEDQPPAGM